MHQVTRTVKKHVLYHHCVSFPGNKKNSLCGLNPRSWTLEKCRVQLLHQKRGNSLSPRQWGKESEVEGGRLRYRGRKASRCEGDTLIKERNHQRRKREKGPHKLAKRSQGLSALHFIYMTDRIDQSDWEQSPWLRKANKDSKCLHCSHPSLS